MLQGQLEVYTVVIVVDSALSKKYYKSVCYVISIF